jgi:hypothetical protein
MMCAIQGCCSSRLILSGIATIGLLPHVWMCPEPVEGYSQRFDKLSAQRG